MMALDPYAEPKHSFTTTVAPVMSPDSQSDSVASDECDEMHATASLSTSVTNYPVENGRRYHRYREGSYPYPNDEPEIERLDMQYHMFKKVNDNRIQFAPIHNPRRILDIGTGTGIWPIEMASLFPQATIYGTDLSPIQPQSVPANVHFVVDDASEPDWLWPLGHFDLIHTGMMLGSFNSYGDLIKNARNYLQPGSGWLECHEIHPKPLVDDGSAPPDYALRIWEDYYNHSANSLESPRPIRIADKCKQWMLEAGFVDVHECIEKVPINPWPKDPRLKEIGRFHEANWLDGLAAFSYQLFGSKGLGWSKDEIEVFLIGVRESIRNRHIHAYNKQYIVYGRRPNSEEEKVMLKAREKERGRREKDHKKGQRW